MEKPASNIVLLIEDDEDDYLIIRRLINNIPDRPFELEWVQDYNNALARIKSRDYAACLVDYRLDGAYNGLDLLAAAQPHKLNQPFIMLTGMGDEAIESQAVTHGATDYLIKGAFDGQLLSRTLRYAIHRKQSERQRIQELIDINRAKDEFISLASHQLRTPATGVKQYVGMVLQGFAGQLTNEQRNMLQKAYESNDRQLAIVSDLLRVAQVDAGRLHLQKMPLALHAMLEDVINEQHSTFNARRQKILATLPTVEVVADHDSIRMVFENIIDNASKYSPEEKEISVRIEDTGLEAAVHVQDNGVGIADEDIGRLFQKFSRIDNPLSTIVGGTGLGLYWAKRIIDLHGGRIQVVSKPAQGTIFSIFLPKIAQE